MDELPRYVSNWLDTTYTEFDSMKHSLPPPVFLFGMDRSGTTLMSMMVGAHPEIAVPLATTGMWFDFYDRLGHYNHLHSQEDVARLIDDVSRHDRIRLWRTELDLERIIGRSRPEDFCSVVEAFHTEYARVQGKPRWANMDIATLDNMHIANRWFPDARFLHIVRDGRDVALSNQSTPYGLGNIAECAEAWARRLKINLRMGDILGPDRYLAFRYESLILDTESTLRRICDFLGVTFSPQMLAYSESVDARVPKEKLWLWPALKSSPQASKVERWKREMSENQRTVFEWAAGPMLQELGYETYDEPSKRFGAYILELMYFLDHGSRSKRLLQKIGIRRTSKLERAAGVRGMGIRSRSL